MKVMNRKDVRVDGRDVTIHRYNMKFQGHEPGDFTVIEWLGGWNTVGNGTSTSMADAVAQTKIIIGQVRDQD